MNTETKNDSTLLQPECNIPRESKKKALPYSPQALKEINNLADSYGVCLTQEAHRIAKREDVDMVSTVHVKDGAKRLLLRNKRNKTKSVSGIVSGAFFGVTLTPLMSSSPIPPYQYIIGLACLFIGVVFALYSVSD